MKKILVGLFLFICWANSIAQNISSPNQPVTTLSVSPCQASFTFTVNGANVSFTNTSSADSSTALQFSWNFGDGSNPSNNNNPSHSYAPGTYTVCLNVIDSITCGPSWFLMTACEIITISDTLVIPPAPDISSSTDIITPNGDGKNDEINLILTGDIIKIYNRFGVLVRTLEYTKVWDGRDNAGEIVQMGFYVAIDEKANTSSHFSVIR